MVSTTQQPALLESSRPFLAYLDTWYHGLPDRTLDELIAGEPATVALISVDMINGFCTTGALASPRINALAQPIADLFTRAHAAGVRALALTQDTHHPDTPEFQAYPPHCIAGTAESATVAPLATLPFHDDITVIEKNSLSSLINTRMGGWFAERPALRTFIVVGNCTDLCVYSMAMDVRLMANAHHLPYSVIVPAHLVNTFDTPVSTATAAGIKAHDGDLHHIMFAHHMALNGIEVIGNVT